VVLINAELSHGLRHCHDAVKTRIDQSVREVVFGRA